jgi:signal peptidase II
MTDEAPAPARVAEPRGPRPPRLRRLKVVALVLIVLGLAVDLVTKDWMQDLLGMDPAHPESTKRIVLIPRLVGLEGTWNTGVTFGLAQGQTEWIFAFTGLAILGLVLWLLATRTPSRALHIGLALVLAGAVGNLYDRWSWHKVRDFLLVHTGPIENPSWKWPNFNAADSFIVVGVGLILWEELFGRARRERRERAATPEGVST